MEPDSTMPVPIPGFIGRDRELQAIERLLKQGINVVELADAPGTVAMGKSALAFQAVQRFSNQHPDYQLYANFHGQDAFPAHARDILQEWLVLQFELDPRTLPQRTSELQALYQQQLEDKRVIVVLDNVTNLPQVQPLLAQSATAPPAAYSVLITSRSPILTAEQGKTLFVNRLESEASQCFFVDDCANGLGEPEPKADLQFDELAAMLDAGEPSDADDVSDGLDNLASLLGETTELAAGENVASPVIDRVDELSAMLDDSSDLAKGNPALAMTSETRSLQQIIKLADGSPFVLSLLSKLLRQDPSQSTDILMLSIEKYKRTYQENYAENLAQLMACLNAVYQTLSVEERDLLSRLSVLHSAQFNTELATHLSGSEDQSAMTARLESLYAKGWLMLMPNLVHLGGSAEYAMPDVARSFLWKKVTAKARRTLVSWALNWQDNDRNEIDRRMLSDEPDMPAAA